MKVHIYTRVSPTNKSRDGDGLGTQAEQCTMWCIENGHKNFQVYRDQDVSGATGLFKRPAMTKLLSNLKRGDIVLADRIDRLNRDVLEFCRLMQEVVSLAGCSLVTVSDGNVARDDNTVLVAIIKAWAADTERKKIVRNVRNGILRARREGRNMSSNTPFGFKNVDGKLEPASGEIEAALEYMKLRSDHGDTAIARILNKNGMTRRNGKPFSPKSVYRMARNVELYEQYV